MKMKEAVKGKRQRRLKTTRKEGRGPLFVVFDRRVAVCPVTDVIAEFPIIL